jgi:hypothetical protein
VGHPRQTGIIWFRQRKFDHPGHSSAKWHVDLGKTRYDRNRSSLEYMDILVSFQVQDFVRTPRDRF